MSLNWRDWSMMSYSNQETMQHMVEQFEYFEDDVLINTYHKCGTTLTQELVYSLLHGVDKAKASNLWLRSPFLDWGREDEQKKRPIDWARQLTRPRVLKTHLPPAFHTRHLSNQMAGPRVLVVLRNPKDAMVSAYHHFVNCTLHEAEVPHNFADFWKLLALGCKSSEVPLHNYFDFTLSWWSFRDHPRVRIFFYEDMVARKADTIRSIAEFLGVQPTEEQVQEVVEHTSFDSMRQNTQVNPTLNENVKSFWGNNFNFMRKGKVGDWRSHFTVADNELMDRLIADKLDPCGLSFTYE